MATMVFINLPVKDLTRTMEFWSKLGYSFDKRFTDTHAAALIVEENSIYVMLLTEPFFQNFTKKQIADAKTSTEAIICLSSPSREAVDELMAKAVAAGGNVPNPKQDFGGMYGHGFEDIDGHLWEIMWMDPNFDPKSVPADAVEKR